MIDEIEFNDYSVDMVTLEAISTKDLRQVWRGSMMSMESSG